MPMPTERAGATSVLTLRSILFVPADRKDRFSKAAASGADAIILDLEDSVGAERKPLARENLRDYLQLSCGVPRFVRVNPEPQGLLAEDCESARGADALVVLKAEGAETILAVRKAWGEGCPPILPIATETAAAIFTLGTYRQVADALCGLTWGAEDLSAAVGARAARDSHGQLTAPYQLARSLALFAARASAVRAIETVYPAIADHVGLIAYANEAARDGFDGMMAIHPPQVAAINAAFTPTESEIARARAIVAAFSSAPTTGVVRLDGQMLDAPHLKQARGILSRADRPLKSSESVQPPDHTAPT